MMIIGRVRWEKNTWCDSDVRKFQRRFRGKTMKKVGGNVMKMKRKECIFERGR